MSETCDVCKSDYEAIYWAPDHVWESIKPKSGSEGGLLCVECAYKRAIAAGYTLRFSGSDAWWITDEIITLHQQLLQSQALVKELAKFVGAGDRLCRELESWLATEHDKESQRAIKIWKKLRQQAEPEKGGDEE